MMPPPMMRTSALVRPSGTKIAFTHRRGEPEEPFRVPTSHGFEVIGSRSTLKVPDRVHCGHVKGQVCTEKDVGRSRTGNEVCQGAFVMSNRVEDDLPDVFPWVFRRACQLRPYAPGVSQAAGRIWKGPAAMDRKDLQRGVSV